MYFTSFTPLYESFNFTLKNLNDLFTIPSDSLVKSTEEKLKRVENEFKTYYKYDKETEGAILEAIGKLIKNNKCDPIDIPKIDKIHHLKLHIQLSFDDKLLSKADFNKFYTVLYREVYGVGLPSYLTKYALLKFVKGRFIVFITFDENSIEDVHTVVSENEYDLTAPVWLEKLNVSPKYFKL